MRPKRLDIDPAASDPDGLADGNSSAGATLTLDGALTSGGTFTSADGLARRISIIDLGADDQSGATFTFTGTDADGRTQTEAITGPGVSATVTSTKYFKTIEALPTIGSPVAGATVDVGTVDEFATQTIPIDTYSPTPATVQFDITGTIDLDVEVSLENPYKRLWGEAAENASPFTTADQEDLAWVVDANLAGETANVVDSLGSAGIRAIRITSNSFTDGAEVQVFITQPNG